MSETLVHQIKVIQTGVTSITCEACGHNYNIKSELSGSIAGIVSGKAGDEHLEGFHKAYFNEGLREQKGLAGAFEQKVTV